MVGHGLRLQDGRCAVKRICTGQFVVEWVAKQTNDFGNFGSAAGIGVQKWDPVWKSWKMLAGVAYAQFNGPNVVCHIAAEGKNWATRHYLWMIFDYPFNQLKVKRITVEVGEGNLPSRRFVEHLGFEQEARLEGAHPTGDLLIYRMRKPQAERWLTLRDSHEKLAA